MIFDWYGIPLSSTAMLKVGTGGLMAADSIAKSIATFISYSRRDSAFVDRLLKRVEGSNLRILIDRAEIYAFEDWWERIKVLIEQADTIIIVITPNFANSPHCAKEIEYARLLRKRLAPLVAEPTDPTSLDPAIRRLNFVFADREDAFESAVATVLEALATNIEWIRQHTDYTRQGIKWQEKGYPKGLLLRSPALEDAEHWASSRPHGTPLAAPQATTYIEKSRQQADKRYRRTVYQVLCVCIVTVLLAAIAFLQKLEAESARQIAVRATAKYDIVKAAVESRKVRTPGAAVITPQLLEILDRTVAQSVSKKRILWVDRSKSNNTDEAKAFIKMDFYIEYASTPGEAIALVPKGFDLIITQFGKNGDNKEDSVAYMLKSSLSKSSTVKVPIIIYSMGVTDAFACSAQRDGFYDETDEPAQLFITAVRSVTGMVAVSRCD